MRARSKRAIAAAGATLAVAAGAGGALAAGGAGQRSRPAVRPGPAAIASYLGLTRAQLRTELGAGKTLAQIAVEHGKTISGLEAAIYADVESHLDQAVANGRLTAAREQAVLDELKTHLDDIVNHAFPAGALRPHRPLLGAAVAAYLGLTPAEVRAQLREGKSLAQVATAQGKSVDGLKKAILDAAKARLDKAVAAGRLSATLEQKVLDRLQAHVDELVNRTRPATP